MICGPWYPWFDLLQLWSLVPGIHDLIYRNYIYMICGPWYPWSDLWSLVSMIWFIATISIWSVVLGIHDLINCNSIYMILGPWNPWSDLLQLYLYDLWSLVSMIWFIATISIWSVVHGIHDLIYCNYIYMICGPWYPCVVYNLII